MSLRAKLKPGSPLNRHSQVPMIVGLLYRIWTLLIVNRRLVDPLAARPPWYTRSHGSFSILASMPLLQAVRIWVTLPMFVPAASVTGPALAVPLIVSLQPVLTTLLTNVVSCDYGMTVIVCCGTSVKSPTSLKVGGHLTVPPRSAMREIEVC